MHASGLINGQRYIPCAQDAYVKSNVQACGKICTLSDWQETPACFWAVIDKSTWFHVSRTGDTNHTLSKMEQNRIQFNLHGWSHSGEQTPSQGLPCEMRALHLIALERAGSMLWHLPRLFPHLLRFLHPLGHPRPENPAASVGAAAASYRPGYL